MRLKKHFKTFAYVFCGHICYIVQKRFTFLSPICIEGDLFTNEVKHSK